MRDEIYEDYLKLRMQVDDAESALRSARTNEIDIHKKLKMVREAYSREEAALLATDERAGGKNADERKANATNLVHEEKAEGGKLHGYWLAVLMQCMMLQDELPKHIMSQHPVITIPGH